MWRREGRRFCASSEVSNFVCQVVCQLDRGLLSGRLATPDAFQAQMATTLTSIFTQHEVRSGIVHDHPLYLTRPP